MKVWFWPTTAGLSHRKISAWLEYLQLAVIGQKRTFSERIPDEKSMSSLAVAALLTVSQSAAFITAAHRFVPDVRWRANSVVSADFTCRGHEDVALLGTTAEEIVIAVFLDGSTKEPKVFHYSAKVRNAATATLNVEPPGEDADAPSGSGACYGLRLDDGEIDAAHIYWNAAANEFGDWVR